MYQDVLLQGLSKMMQFMSCLLYHFAGRKKHHPENSWHVEDYVKHLHLDFVGAYVNMRRMECVLGSTAYVVVLFEQLEALTFSLQGWPTADVQLGLIKILRYMAPSVSRVTFIVSKLCVRRWMYILNEDGYTG